MMQKNKSSVLTIAGSDSSGGAGIQADIKTISAIGCYAASVITALTAQNTLGVQSIQEIPPQFVAQQLESVFSDITFKAIKVGMLHNKEIIAVVADALQKYKLKNIVLDPVMFSKNGCALLNPNTLIFLQEKLFPLITLITPNLLEAENLLDTKITTTLEQEAAAIELGDKYKINVLIKGGHFSGEESSDVLYQYQLTKCHWFHAKRIPSQNTHGTGCTLSSAIAAYLAKDYSLTDAISAAKKYLTDAIAASQHWHLGSGHGPLDHFYFLQDE